MAASGSDEGDVVSHGICGPCARRLEGELGIPLRDFLQSLDVPVYLVDVETGGRVRGANRKALDLVGAGEEATRGRLLGDVFECANAALPEGCGRTVHCSGCAIRTSVEHTWRTGEPKRDVPTFVQPQNPAAPLLPSLRISTERVGQRVVLRIRPATEDEPGAGTS